MRSGAARGHEGYFHETAFYGSDDEFVALVAPFVLDGVSAGEPTLVVCGDTNEKLLREALRDAAGITYLPADDQYARPTTAIKRYREAFVDLTASGARQIRVVGDVPHPGIGVPWDWWARYEAVVNHAFHDFPLWGMCPYDTRTTPAAVLADVARTHPRIVTADGLRRANSRFQEPQGFLAARPKPLPDLLEARSPAVLLVDPAPSEARRAAREAVAGTTLSPDEAEDLVFAASEIVTNGLSHGRPPVRFRLWADRHHVVVTVTDQGPGPADPMVGLLPTTETATAGLGLWLAYHTCSYVTLGRDDEGFTVRVVAGPPRLAG